VTTGVPTRDAVVELLRVEKPFTQATSMPPTVAAAPRKLAGARGRGGKRDARNGFHGGLVRESIGMLWLDVTRGSSLWAERFVGAGHRSHRFLAAYKVHGEIEPAEAARTGAGGATRRTPAARCPDDGARLGRRIELDGRLLVTQQDALLNGRQGAGDAGFADHVVFRDPQLCAKCAEKTCVAMWLRAGHHAGRGGCDRLRAREVRALRPRACGTAPTRPTASTPTSSSCPAARWTPLAMN